MSQNYTLVDGELYHYGVKGMKWGKRKAREAYVKTLERKKKSDTIDYLAKQTGNIAKPTASPSQTYKKFTENRSAHKAQTTKTNFRIAKQKAKLDPNYKNSDEYKSAVQAHGKQVVADLLRSISNPIVRKKGI